jgi:small subunit ribosomal protein S8
MSIDFIGDFLTIVRNALMARKRRVETCSSKLRVAICEVLEKEGYVRSFSVEDKDGMYRLIVDLKYVRGESVIHEIKRRSKPSRRCYEGVRNIKPTIGGLGIAILSTNAGVMTCVQAKKMRVGGEVICHVW